MKILVACEESQAVTIELRRLGHEAYSCDIEPCSGGHPEWHIQVDALELLKMRWDMILAFPPCTHLAIGGARYFAEKREDGRQQAAKDFFMAFANADCPRIAIENPVGIMSTAYRKPDQIIQPWEYGHGETKKTCLWLKGLPLLRPTDIVSGREPRVWRMPPSAERAKLRSKTYPGVARAMAEQWAGGTDMPKTESCGFCRISYSDFHNDSMEDFVYSNGTIWYNDPVAGWEGLEINYCPMCGREVRIKEERV